MKGLLSLEELKTAAKDETIDTVLVCLVDMQGRLMGKRFHVSNFIDSAWEETHCCDYLLATDLEMGTPGGYASSSWEAGYGDYIMKPDLTTLRVLPWLESTALVLCDILDHHTHLPVPRWPVLITTAWQSTQPRKLPGNRATPRPFYPSGMPIE